MGSKYISVPRSLVTLISTIIGGSSVVENISTAESKVAVNIAQLIQFNIFKHKCCKEAEMDKIRH